MLCPECPHESVRVFTSEKARQAHRARAHGHRAMARDFVSDERCPACGKVFGSRPMAIGTLAMPSTTMLAQDVGRPGTHTLSSCDSNSGWPRSDSRSHEVHEGSIPCLTAPCTPVISVLCHSLQHVMYLS